jgi:polysaccharide export outer membrane protein
MLTSKLKAVAGMLVLIVGIGLGAGAATWQYVPAGRGVAPAKADAEGKSAAAAEKEGGAKPSSGYAYSDEHHAPGPEKKTEVAARAYVVEPPDILLVEYAPRGDADPVKITGRRLLRPDGTIALGQLGSVFVAGLTIEGARDAIAKHLARRLDDFDPNKLAVDVAAFNSKLVYVIYKGVSGGSHVYRFPLTGGRTVLDAIVEAKVALIGIGKKRIFVQRMSDDGKSSQVLPVDWEAITQRGSTVTNYELRPGDRVQVESPVPKKAAAGEGTGSDPVREIEAVVKVLREAHSREEQRRAVEDLDVLTKKLRERLKEVGSGSRL